MSKVIGNTIEERAKSYANNQCHCYKCDGIDNFTHRPCKQSLDGGCQKHRWIEWGYVRGAQEQREIDIKKMYDYMCGYCSLQIDVTRGIAEECTPQEKETCDILKGIKTYMEV